MDYGSIFWEQLKGYAGYMAREVTTPHWGNYFYWLLGLSLLVYALELLFPWRKDQPKVRRDFWIDGFYMFFNFFGFSLLGYQAASQVLVTFFNTQLAHIGITNLVAVRVNDLPVWAQLATLFVLRDFVQWNVHRLLHRVPQLWAFHQVHHSVTEMGFAAHLRYHPVETIVYRTLEYLPMALIGYGIDDFMIVHLIALTIGHLNHANVGIPMGPLKYLFNSARMHIWHHVALLPSDRSRGINFGISLSLWDYLFGHAYLPHDGRDIRLGFPEIESFPTGFFGHLAWPFRKRSSEEGRKD